MLIDWPKFGGALLLLLVPTAAFHGAKVRYRPISSDWDRHWTRILSLGFHTIDLLRAVLGAWLLFNALQTVPDARGLARYSVLLTEGGVFMVSAFIQTLICKEPESANAPFTFVAGLVLGASPPLVAGFAIVIGAVVAMGSRTPAAFFPALAVSMPLVGFLFTGKRLLLVLALFAIPAVIPWLLSLMFSRELVIAYRARRAAETRVASGSEMR